MLHYSIKFCFFQVTVAAKSAVLNLVVNQHFHSPFPLFPNLTRILWKRVRYYQEAKAFTGYAEMSTYLNQLYPSLLLMGLWTQQRLLGAFVIQINNNTEVPPISQSSQRERLRLRHFKALLRLLSSVWKCIRCHLTLTLLALEVGAFCFLYSLSDYGTEATIDPWRIKISGRLLKRKIQYIQTALEQVLSL